MSQLIGQTKLALSRPWHHISLSTDPRPLGRIATSIALTLMGKHKPIYNPGIDCGDYVVVTGCSDLHVTGKKMEQKKYYSHSTRPGSLKSMSMEQLMGKWGGGEILKRAVRGMLPKNKLRDKRMSRLKTFEDHRHPYRRNLMKLPEHSIASMPEIQQTLQAEQATTAPS